MITVLVIEFVIGVILGLARIHFLLYRAIRYGRLMANRKRWIANSDKSPLALKIHTKATKGAIAWMVVFVVFLEINLRLLGIEHYGWYRVTHMGIAITGFVVLLATLVYFNGEEAPRVHKWFAYMGVTLFEIATVTGIPMFAWDLWQKLFTH